LFVCLLAVKWICELVGELVGWNFVCRLFRRLISGLVCWSPGQFVGWSVDPLICGSFGWSVHCSIFQPVMQAFSSVVQALGIWLVDWWVGWWVVGCLLGWLVGRFVVGLVSWLVGCFVIGLVWLVNWLFSRWVDLLVELFLTVGQLIGLSVGW